MSAPDEDTFAEEGGEMEEMDKAGSDEDGGEEMEEEGADEEGEKKVYVPGIEPLQPGEELEMDRSAYRMYHECQTGEFNLHLPTTLSDVCAASSWTLCSCCLCPGAPCLSFDILRDADGDGREHFPVSMLLCAGTQADTALSNRSVQMTSCPWRDGGYTLLHTQCATVDLP